MTMKYDQWKRILSAIDNEADLSKDNVIEKIKEKLKAADEGEYKKWDEVGFDVNHKFTVEGETLLHLAAASGCTKIVEALLKADNINVNPKDNNERTPLHLAAQEGYKEVVNLLLKREDIDVNAIDKDKHTPLHLAVKKGHIGVVNNLLEVGADVNVEDENGKTPLHTAVQFGCGEGIEVLIGKVMIRALIKAGAKVNAEDKDTPLHIAASRDFSGKIVKTLIKGKANIDAVDKCGRTPLHFATDCFSSTNIEILIENGADYSLKNKNGEAPIDFNEHVARLAREKEQKQAEKMQERKEFLQAVQLRHSVLL